MARSWSVPRVLLWILAGFLCLVVIASAALFFVDEPARRWAQNELNERLTGYSIELPELRLHLVQLSAEIGGLTIRQDAHPEPPVVTIAKLHAGLDWRALLHARIVGSFDIDTPKLHIDRAQLQEEANDAVDLADKGWQEALDVFPLEVNRIVVSGGSTTYIDADPAHPLELSQIELLAKNIRKVEGGGETNPSTLWIDAAVFESGHLRIDGRTDLLAAPYPTIDSQIDLEDVPLEKLGPLAEQVNIRVRGGRITAGGRVEVTPQSETVHLRMAVIDGVAVDYIHSAETEAAEARRLEQVEATAKDIADRRQLEVRIDELSIRNSTLGYIDRMREPPYRLYLDQAQITLRDVSTGAEVRPAVVAVTGRFMGAGATRLDAWFEQRREDADMDVALQIEPTPMKRMNDLFRRYGAFDVAGGEFSFYTQLKVYDGHVDGYVKPFFADVDVYDKRQDADKALFRQLYEGLVGGIARLLENPRDEVATDANVTGKLDSPRIRTWSALVNLVRNAFFEAILPGFDRAVREQSAG